MTDTSYRENHWSCFFWRLAVCVVLAIITYMLG